MVSIAFLSGARGPSIPTRGIGRQLGSELYYWLLTTDSLTLAVDYWPLTTDYLIWTIDYSPLSIEY